MAGKRTPSLIAGVRAAASDFTVSVGMLTMRGGLYSPLVPNAKKDDKTVLACPTCDHPVKPDQKYVCPECGSQSSSGECKRALPDFSEFIDPEAVKEAKQSTDLEEKYLALSVHPAHEVMEQTFPGEKTWIFRPKDKPSVELYNALLETLPALTDQVMVGRVNLGAKMGEKFVRFTIEHGELVLQELVRPEDRLDLPPAEVVEVPEAHLAMTKTLIEALEEPFEPDAYRNQARQRILALKAAVSGGTAPAAGKPVTAPKVDLTTALEAALAAAKSKKAS